MCSRPVTADDGNSDPVAVAAAADADSSSQANLNRYRLHLYNYALQAERLRLSGGWCPAAVVYPGAAGVYPPARFPVAALFHHHPAAGQNGIGIAMSGGGGGGVGVGGADEPKPQHSYIGLIAMAILGSADGKLVLSDIYQYILDNYPYFRTRGPGWRNSIRHNLSLNDCFVKAGRSANGKGHYWAIHPANVDDFKKGDFRRRKAQRKVRRHMGLAVDDDGNDSPSPPPQPPPLPPVQPPPQAVPPQQQLLHPLPASVWPPPMQTQQPPHSAGGPFYFQPIVTPQPPMIRWPYGQRLATVAAPVRTQQHHQQQHQHQQQRKRQFDVASLLAPDPPKRFRNNDAGAMRRRRTTITTTTTTTTGGGSSEDDDDGGGGGGDDDGDDDETRSTCDRNGVGIGIGGGDWEPAAGTLLQRYYEHQLQTAHRLHAIRQSLGLHRMIGGPWPTVICADTNNVLRTPTPPALQPAQPPYCTTATASPDDHIKTELVD